MEAKPAEKKPSGFFGKLFGGSKTAAPAALSTEKGKEKVQGLKGLKKADVNVVCSRASLLVFR